MKFKIGDEVQTTQERFEYLKTNPKVKERFRKNRYIGKIARITDENKYHVIDEKDNYNGYWTEDYIELAKEVNEI